MASYMSTEDLREKLGIPLPSFMPLEKRNQKLLRQNSKDVPEGEDRNGKLRAEFNMRKKRIQWPNACGQARPQDQCKPC